MRIQELQLPTVALCDFRLSCGQALCLLGGNGSGKSALAAVLAGKLEAPGVTIEEPASRVAWASFETQQAVYEAELLRDDSDFMDGQDPGSTALEIVTEAGCDEATARRLAADLGPQVVGLLDRHYRQLSSGEARQILLLQALASEPDLLILDEPYEGLDREARARVSQLCARAATQERALLLLVNRLEDVPSWATHLGLMQRGRLVTMGTREEVLARPELAQLVAFDTARVPRLPPAPGDAPTFDPVLRFRACSVVYDGVAQFAGLDWELAPLAHTSIVGPNGAGKSTLLQLISGDHPQCYTNDILAFGYRRGSGESIWDIKKHIGLVSAALHRDYRASGNALSVVLSGLYDSIGVYQRPGPRDLALAQAFLEVLGMADLAQRPFRELSYGQQRLLLIGRGLIKQPALLILDEPTQGLDDLNRQLVLSFLSQLSHLERTTMLFVSHREDEHLPIFRRRLRFVPAHAPDVRFNILHEAVGVP